MKDYQIIKPVYYKDKYIEVKINPSRINKNIQKAQYWLDSQIFADMMPYMPHVTGTFRNVTQAHSQALAGTGYVEAGTAPMGRFLYYGKLMVDPITMSPWARKGAKKVVVNVDLNYKSGQARWFERAKKEHLQQWIDGVEKILNGG